MGHKIDKCEQTVLVRLNPRKLLMKSPECLAVCIIIQILDTKSSFFQIGIFNKDLKNCIKEISFFFQTQIWDIRRYFLIKNSIQDIPVLVKSIEWLRFGQTFWFVCLFRDAFKKNIFHFCSTSFHVPNLGTVPLVKTHNLSRAPRSQKFGNSTPCFRSLHRYSLCI